MDLVADIEHSLAHGSHTFGHPPPKEKEQAKGKDPVEQEFSQPVGILADGILDPMLIQGHGQIIIPHEGHGDETAWLSGRVIVERQSAGNHPVGNHGLGNFLILDMGKEFTIGNFLLSCLLIALIKLKRDQDKNQIDPEGKIRVLPELFAGSLVELNVRPFAIAEVKLGFFHT